MRTYGRNEISETSISPSPDDDHAYMILEQRIEGDVGYVLVPNGKYDIGDSVEVIERTYRVVGIAEYLVRPIDPLNYGKPPKSTLGLDPVYFLRD